MKLFNKLCFIMHVFQIVLVRKSNAGILSITLLLRLARDYIMFLEIILT